MPTLKLNPAFKFNNVYQCLVVIFMMLPVLIGLSACSQAPKPALGQGAGQAVPGSQQDFAQNVGYVVRFTTDSTQLTPEAQTTLQGQVAWLKKYAQYSVTLEGHADERGTREYNLALGARRATAVKNYMISLGVSPARLRTISYGKERPIAICNNISCWSQNRRVETKLNSRAGL